MYPGVTLRIPPLRIPPLRSEEKLSLGKNSVTLLNERPCNPQQPLLSSAHMHITTPLRALRRTWPSANSHVSDEERSIYEKGDGAAARCHNFVIIQQTTTTIMLLFAGIFLLFPQTEKLNQSTLLMVWPFLSFPAHAARHKCTQSRTRRITLSTTTTTAATTMTTTTTTTRRREDGDDADAHHGRI